MKIFRVNSALTNHRAQFISHRIGTTNKNMRAFLMHLHFFDLFKTDPPSAANPIRIFILRKRRLDGNVFVSVADFY